LVDKAFIVRSNNTARIQEVHITFIHAICRVLDLCLAGEIEE
jgi:D-sedoheptulose 7-phosphate isomerase